ncbi:secreted RxLR effector protein 78-like [Arachis stenosperma]|uniref:secreted RxLR effector protein 78-like n=1 Tax=Arachis stenosperma TaxID=217475 RepID=UPI0025AD3983|nr:secreted RxLR effector protein 78-like [Arachis stenosperma]
MLKLKRRESAIIKLDFQKAYDIVKWNFVDVVLEKMGFEKRWRAWVAECIMSASISILINGSPSKPFKMERGLRQGDPLSPFLFVLVVDVLNRMIGEAEETVRNYKRLLRCFKVMSGLSINFEKSSLIPANCSQE